MLAGALDQGYWPDGVYTSPTDAALRFDIEAAKRLGLVAIRKHLKIEPERYYYWADRLGLLILQDFPSGQDGDPYTDLPTSPEASTACEMERRLLIRAAGTIPRSSPGCCSTKVGVARHPAACGLGQQLDPTRLIDEASGFPRHGGGDIHDTHGGDAPQDGRRISLDSETAGFGLNAIGHSWPGKPGQQELMIRRPAARSPRRSCIPLMRHRKAGTCAGWPTSIARCGENAKRPAPAATSRSNSTTWRPRATDF